MNELNLSSLGHSSIVKAWIARIGQADPMILAIAKGIAREAILDPAYDREAAAKAKAQEWKLDHEQTGKALLFAVNYYYEEYLQSGVSLDIDEPL